MEVIAQSQHSTGLGFSRGVGAGSGNVDLLMALHINVARLARAAYTWKAPSQSGLDSLKWMLPGAI